MFFSSIVAGDRGNKEGTNSGCKVMLPTNACTGILHEDQNSKSDSGSDPVLVAPARSAPVTAISCTWFLSKSPQNEMSRLQILKI